MPANCPPINSLTNLCVTPDSKKKATFRTLEQQYGDGYMARRQDGLNPVNEMWSVSIPPDKVSNIITFENELIALGAGNFAWTPPNEAKLTPEKRWVLDPPQWDWTYQSSDIASLSFNLKRWYTATGAGSTAKVTVTSTSFAAGGEIPGDHVFDKNGCGGSNNSPQLSWSIANLPPGRSVSTWRVSCIDTSASDFVHWDVQNIPAAQTSIAENANWTGSLEKYSDIRPTGFEPDFGSRSNGWAGPCPPVGPAHTYNITATAVLDNGTLVKSAALVFTKDA